MSEVGVVEFGRVKQAAVHGRHDLATAHDGDGSAHLLEQVGRQADGPVFEALQLLRTGDLLLEPAERLGGHGAGEEADEVKAQNLLHELVIKRLAAAVFHPADHLVGAPAPGGRRAEQGEGLVLSVPIGRHAMAAVKRAGQHRVLHLKRLGDGTCGQQLDLQAAAAHIIDAIDEILRVFVEDVLRGPGALKLEDDRLLGAGDVWHGERGARPQRRWPPS